jgi:hypothetical protein
MWDFFQPLFGAFRAAVMLACHLLVATIILIVIRGVEFTMHVLWADNDPLLFDQFPLRYLFHAMDVGVMVLFIVFGLIKAARAFREP